MFFQDLTVSRLTYLVVAAPLAAPGFMLQFLALFGSLRLGKVITDSATVDAPLRRSLVEQQARY
jgi:hypothetical protein